MTMKLKWVNHIGIAFELDFDNNFTEEEAYDRAEEQLREILNTKGRIFKEAFVMFQNKSNGTAKDVGKK